MNGENLEATIQIECITEEGKKLNKLINAGFVHNVARSVQTATEELMEIAVYNANRNSEVNKAWEQFSNDLEKIQEDTDGR